MDGPSIRQLIVLLVGRLVDRSVREREKEIEREKERETDRQRETERDGQRETDRERQSESGDHRCLVILSYF